MSLDFLTITDIRSRLQDGSLTATAYANHCLERASANETLNCFISLDEAQVRQAAESADLSTPLGGVPIALKDLLLKEGTTTTAGSRMLENFTSPYTATAVSRLEQAGAVSLGKTNMDEFAMGSSNENSYFGAVKNPWDPTLVPGGSSGGSAACVAAGITPAALGSDTGGSVRQPASFCGIVGLKPTYGRISRYGVVAFASSLDQIGIFSRTCQDASSVLAAVAGHDRYDGTSEKQEYSNSPLESLDSLSGLRVGIPKEYFIDGIDPEVRQAVETALAQYEKLGATLVDIDLPHTEHAVAVYYIIAPAEASSNLSRYDGIRYGHRAEGVENLADMITRSRTEGFGDEVQRRILLGTYVLSRGYYDAFYLKAQAVRSLIKQDFSSALSEQCDVIACPVTPTPAFEIGAKCDDPVKMYLNDIFTIPASLAGLPAMSIPCGFTSTGLPLGLQLIGNAWDERRLLEVGHCYQQSTEWHLQTPTL